MHKSNGKRVMAKAINAKNTAPKVILLTGGIASGKTFASDYLREKGAYVIDTDVVARMMTDPENPKGREALTEIANRFGSGYITAEGMLDRRKMRELIFTNPEAKTDLESILHGRIWSEVKEEIANADDAPYIVLVVPVIYEGSPYLRLVSEVLIIEVPYQLQLQRVMARDNIDEALAQKIIEAQISRLDRRKLGNDIIISENRAFVRRQLDKLHNRYSARENRHA